MEPDRELQEARRQLVVEIDNILWDKEMERDGPLLEAISRQSVARWINAKSVGVTPKWMRALANHKAVMSQEIDEPG